MKILGISPSDIISLLKGHESVLLYPKLAVLLNKILPLKQPPVLVVSLPRAGSSWVGSILGRSKNSLYLREPITQSYMRSIDTGPSFFELTKCQDINKYIALSNDAFSGIPKFKGGIIPYSNQWKIKGRKAKHLVIKEVNPLAINMFIENYRPKIIYLVRHPVSIANSFFVQGWTGEQFNSRFSNETLDVLKKDFVLEGDINFWKQIGALQGIIHNKVISWLKPEIDFMVVKYEDICLSPLNVFLKIFEFSGLDMSDEVKEHILSSSTAEKDYRPGNYDTSRNSFEMINKWKSIVAKEHIDQVKAGYLSNNPLFYTEEEYWI